MGVARFGLMRTGGWIFVLLALLGAGPAAAAGLCDSLKLPSPEIQIEAIPAANPPIDRSLNIVQLTMRARDRGAASSGNGRVAGLTEAEFKLAITELRIASLRYGGQLCAGPGRVQVRLQAVQRVYLVNSSRHDACWEKAILEHEFHHVEYNNEAVQETARLAKAKLAQMKPIAAPTIESAGNSLAASIDGIIKEAAATAFAAARTKHAALDHPRAYQDMRVQCDPGNRLNSAEERPPQLPPAPKWRTGAPGQP
jgi:hypothetical protein